MITTRLPASRRFFFGEEPHTPLLPRTQPSEKL